MIIIGNEILVQIWGQLNIQKRQAEAGKPAGLQTLQTLRDFKVREDVWPGET